MPELNRVWKCLRVNLSYILHEDHCAPSSFLDTYLLLPFLTIIYKVENLFPELNRVWKSLRVNLSYILDKDHCAPSSFLDTILFKLAFIFGRQNCSPPLLTKKQQHFCHIWLLDDAEENDFTGSPYRRTVAPSWWRSLLSVINSWHLLITLHLFLETKFFAYLVEKKKKNNPAISGCLMMRRKIISLDLHISGGQPPGTQSTILSDNW